jgi:hypothetical protein
VGFVGGLDRWASSRHAEFHHEENHLRFHARDVHLVLGTAAAGRAIRFRVTIDGKEPGEHHGVDTDAQGYGTVTEHRLYQLIRQRGGVDDRTFEIEFLGSGVQAFAFTFG